MAFRGSFVKKVNFFLEHDLFLVLILLNNAESLYEQYAIIQFAKRSVSKRVSTKGYFVTFLRADPNDFHPSSNHLVTLLSGSWALPHSTYFVFNHKSPK